MRRPAWVRFTVRRMMATVAIVAIFTASGMLAGRWMIALRDYEKYRGYYAEGRVTIGPVVRKSERLMEARLALCLTRSGQVTAINAHIKQTMQLLEEQQDPFEYNSRNPTTPADFTEAQLSVKQSKRLIEHLGYNCE